jgi:hypothetical protein
MKEEEEEEEEETAPKGNTRTTDIAHENSSVFCEVRGEMEFNLCIQNNEKQNLTNFHHTFLLWRSFFFVVLEFVSLSPNE